MRTYTYMCVYKHHTSDGRADVPMLFPSLEKDSKFTLFQFSKNQTIFLPKTKPTQTLQLFWSIFDQDQHVGLDSHNSQHRLKNINIKLFVPIHHTLTHARLAIWISIDLSIILYDWETGWQRRNLLFTLFWTGAAARVLTTTIITVKHPEWIASFPFCSWSMFCLKIKENNQPTKTPKNSRAFWMQIFQSQVSKASKGKVSLQK